MNIWCQITHFGGLSTGFNNILSAFYWIVTAVNNVFLATVFLATKMLLCFKKTKKTTKDIAETTKSGLRTVQCIIKTNYHLRKRCGWKKTLNDRGQRSL